MGDPTMMKLSTVSFLALSATLVLAAGTTCRCTATTKIDLSLCCTRRSDGNDLSAHENALLKEWIKCTKPKCEEWACSACAKQTLGTGMCKSCFDFNFGESW